MAKTKANLEVRVVEEGERDVIIKTASFTYGRKINLGDYNSVNLECTLWCDIGPGEQENLDEVMKALINMATEVVEAKKSRLPEFAKVKARAEEAFLGLKLAQEAEDESDLGIRF